MNASQRPLGAFALAASLLAACVVQGPELESEERDLTAGVARDAAWSCNGLAGSTKSPTGVYYVTSFGCWLDSNGNPHGDAGDNCIPYCAGVASAQPEYQALCPSMTGKQCEQHLGWYAADSDRFGCMARIKVTNPDNGKAAVLAVIDKGPNCKIENKVDHWVLDMSYPASFYLFGEAKAATEKGDVVVEEVASWTPLGPWSDDGGGSGGSGGDDSMGNGGDGGGEVGPTLDPIDVVVDSNNAFNAPDSYCNVSSNWTGSSNVSGYYHTGYWWRSTGPSSDAASFVLHLDEPRMLTVEAWWPAASDRSPNAPFVIYDADGNELDTVYVNQQTHGSQWVTLGTYSFTPGYNQVDLSRWTGSGYVVVADAVRFVSP